MNDKEKLQILEYWINNPTEIAKIPKNSEKRITKTEIEFFFAEIELPEGCIDSSSIGIPELMKHADKIRKKIKEELEIKSMNLHNKVLKKQTDLSEKQTDLFEEANKIQSKQNRTIWCQIIVTIFLIGATIFLGLTSNDIANTQTIISEKQTEILERTNQPYKPHIEIVADYDDLIIPAWAIVSKRNINISRKDRWPEIDITIFNHGIRDSQKIYCYTNYSSNFDTYFTPDIFENIIGSTSTKTHLHIAHRNCTDLEKNNMSCDKPEQVPPGHHNITIICECDGCEESQKKLNKTISFCVYKDKDEECYK